MKRRTIFLCGIASGAWLNIWPPAIWQWGGFIFAYPLVFVALAALSFERHPGDPS